MVTYIDEYRTRFGVEPICTTLQIAASTYYAATSRGASPRMISDEALSVIIRQLHEENFSVYGARKVWKAMRRAGHEIGRDQVARLMKANDLCGVRRFKRVRTTRSDATNIRSPDLVDRDFTATRPNQLWVIDITFVATWAGIAYVCLITDAYSRMIVGWRVASHMRTSVVLDAVEMARHQRATNLDGLCCHSDAGSQFTSLRYGERIIEIGARPSIGSVGDSYDNALAESVNALYKTELVRGPNRRPWRTIDELELATLSWVHWHNQTRLHSYLGDIPPVEYETNYATKISESSLTQTKT